MTPQIRKATRQCTKKAKLDSEYDALAHMRMHHGSRPEFNAYLCPHCEFWHVGHRIRPPVSEVRCSAST